MKRFAYLPVAILSIAALVGACASMQQQGLDLVTRAVQASGGRDGNDDFFKAGYVRFHDRLLMSKKFVAVMPPFFLLARTPSHVAAVDC